MVEGGTSVRLTAAEFSKLSAFIYKNCGINLSLPKKVLVESRLQKRLSVLKLNSFSAYCDYVMSPAGLKDELVYMIDAVATNKTDFFREPVHFQFMQDNILPEFVNETRGRTFKVWSSACSSGEEPYTTAMVLDDFLAGYKVDFRIVASDISTKILSKAIEAIYPERCVTDIPMAFRKKYLLRSKNKENPTVRIVPQLRSKVQFKRINLVGEAIDLEADFDLIFCRNVLIYFDRKTQEEVVNKLLLKLKPGGYLFIGHSESIYHMDVPVRQLRPTIFQKV